MQTSQFWVQCVILCSVKKTFANDSFNATVFFAPFVAVSDLSGSHHRLLMTLTRRTPLEPAKCSSLKGCPIYGDSHKRPKFEQGRTLYPFIGDVRSIKTSIRRELSVVISCAKVFVLRNTDSLCVCTRDLELTKYAGVSWTFRGSCHAQTVV